MEGPGAVPKFRWPANGRVIASYGPTTNGQQNDYSQAQIKAACDKVGRGTLSQAQRVMDASANVLLRWAALSRVPIALTNA